MPWNLAAASFEVRRQWLRPDPRLANAGTSDRSEKETE
jgi:hypothetical protein